MKILFSLLLLLGLSQSHPILEERRESEVQTDISSMILASNNASTQILMEGDLVAPRTRNAMYCWYNDCLWKKNADGSVTIPYTVSRSYDSWDRKKIQKAMKTYSDSTCVRFEPRQHEYDYISIENYDGCWSSLGRTGGKQVLSAAFLELRACESY